MAVVWVALAIEAIVLFAAAVAAVRWVRKPASNTTAEQGGQAPAFETAGGVVEQPA